MARRPDLPCADCGKLMWGGTTSLPAGQARCRPCRRSVHGKPATQYKNYGCRCTECVAGEKARKAAINARWKAEHGISYDIHLRQQRGPVEGDRSSHWITRAERLAIYERDAWTCQMCNTETLRAYDWAEDNSPTLDHIIPRTKGGSSDADNLRLTCRSCNSRKGNRSMDVEDKHREMAAN